MSNSHQHRVITALVLAPALVLIVFSANKFLLSAGFLLISILALCEYYSFFWPSGQKKFLKFFGALLAGILFGFATFKRLDFLLLGSLVAFWSCLLLFLYFYSKDSEKTCWADSQILLSGLVYIPFFLQLIIFLSPMEIMLVLLATAATDTGAFYAGKHLGRKKMWPAVSPKKTWVGSLGGLLVCLMVSVAWGGVFGTVSWWHWIWIGALLNLAAQSGDFFQSALKRHCRIKDSGTLLPGHGGMLDRIDSLLLSLPVYFILHIIYSPF